MTHQYKKKNETLKIKQELGESPQLCTQKKYKNNSTKFSKLFKPLTAKKNQILYRDDGWLVILTGYQTPVDDAVYHIRLTT